MRRIAILAGMTVGVLVFAAVMSAASADKAPVTGPPGEQLLHTTKVIVSGASTEEAVTAASDQVKHFEDKAQEALSEAGKSMSEQEARSEADGYLLSAAEFRHTLELLCEQVASPDCPAQLGP
jgi:hypothetical protein